MGYFYMNGKQYEILAEINRQQRNKPADLRSIYVRSDKGEMIQLDNLIALEENVAPPQLYHYNRFLSATVSAGLAKGKTIGQGLDEMDRIAAETLGDDFRTALAGDSKEFRESSSSLMFAFLLAILLIYLILAAQFESFKDPLVIMLTVPLAIAGALVFMAANGQTMNIFSQIGIIMLIGLVAKNGILIVEFANQKQEAGIDKLHAIEEASLQRLRPILMTSASTILGLLPLTVATGEGANGRIAMGIAVVGGMVVSTLLTLYIVPAIYSYVSTDRSQETEIRKPNETSDFIGPGRGDFRNGGGTARSLYPPQVPGNRAWKTTTTCASCAMRSASATTMPRRQMPAWCRRSTSSAGYSGTLDNERTTPREGDAIESDNGIYDQTFNAGINLNWTIFDGFRIRTNYKKLQRDAGDGHCPAPASPSRTS